MVPIKLGYLAFREALAASARRLFPSPTPSDERYTAMYEAYISSRPQDDYDRTHAIRFRETAKVFGPYLSRAKSVLELGGHSRIGIFVRDVFGASYESYEHELREPYDLPDGRFDTVLCLEVLEHLKDARSSEDNSTDINDIACWNYSGVLNALREILRVLQPRGVLLVTTPNATSVDVIGRVLAGAHPHMFDPHVRELAPNQVKAFAELVGFSLELFGTFFAWGEYPVELRQKISDMIVALGFDPSHRGDDAYYAFRRK